MTRGLDLTGVKIGFIKVLERSSEKTRHGKPIWICLCDCGTVWRVEHGSLMRGRTVSCGCFHQKLLTTHGYSTDGVYYRLYRCWADIKQRCTNPKLPSYDDYGGRGIKMCDRWLISFPDFLEDVKDLYIPGYTIDRINNDGNYEPGNVRWVDRLTQSKNQRKRRSHDNRI